MREILDFFTIDKTMAVLTTKNKRQLPNVGQGKKENNGQCGSWKNKKEAKLES